MKNVFGINTTDDKDNVTTDGQVFISNSIPPEMSDALDKCIDITESIEGKAALPLWMRIIMHISGYGSIILAAGIVNGLADVTFKQAYANAPYLFYCTIILFFVWLALFMTGRSKRKNIENSDEFEQTENYVKRVVSSSREMLNIPVDAKDIDILTFYYKVKNGKMKVVNKGIVTYMNFVCKVYVKENSLHMADLKEELAIPLDSITGFKKINKKTSVPEWNKETPPNKGEYKKYKIVINNAGLIYFKPYYALCIEWNGESYELFIPPYELDTISSLIGLEYSE